MTLTQQQLECILSALLAVNKFPLTRVIGLTPALVRAELFNPHFVAGADVGDITVRLATAGYNRGLLTGMFAERLQGVMKAYLEGQFNQVAEALSSGDRARVIEVLQDIPGLGPKTAEAAWTLLCSATG